MTSPLTTNPMMTIQMMTNLMRHRSLISMLRRQAAGTVAASAILLGLIAVAPPAAPAQTFTIFEASGAGTGKYQGTAPTCISTVETIAGIYFDSSNLAHGFVRLADGSITGFDAPGAGTGKNQGTFPISINTAGTIVGMYSDASNVYHGFVRTKSGTITSFDVPGEGTGKHQGTVATGINTAGTITGMYKDSSSQYHGFVLPAKSTVPVSFEAPGAGTGYAVGTIPGGINTAGVITGYYVDQSSTRHGFVRAANGATITSIDAPGAGTGANQGTVAISINTAGAIAGEYSDASSVAHGFVRTANGLTITTFEAPGAATASWLASVMPLGSGPPLEGTNALSINAAGVITGVYTDTGEVVHGFMRTANGKAITAIDAPGAGTGMLEGTVGIAVNTAGYIAGFYLDADSAFHGFLLTPPTVTTTTLTSAPNPSTYGQAVAFTAVVTPKAGAVPDGEAVSFMKGTTVLGTGMLSGGSATFTTSTLNAGTDAIKAVYAGDPNFATSTSKPVSQVVNKATTATSLVSSLNPSNAEQSVTFSASVAPELSGKVTGTVSFYNGTTLLKTVGLSGGTAKYTTNTLTPGMYTIEATYNGSTSFEGSSASLIQTVNSRSSLPLTQPVNSVPDLTGAQRFTDMPRSAIEARKSNTRPQYDYPLCPSTTKALVYGTTYVTQPLTVYGVMDMSQGCDDQTFNYYFCQGTITFSDYVDGHKNLLGTGSPIGGNNPCTRVFNTSSLTAGTHVIVADFEGNPDYRRSSGDVTVEINTWPTTTTVISSQNPSAYGQDVTFTVTAAGGIENAPTGKVSISDGGVVLGTAALNGNGAATFTVKKLPAGTNSITAEYHGDGLSAQSTSAVLNQIVNPASTLIGISSQHNPASVGETITFTAGVVSPTGGIPTGTVTFSAGGTTLGTIALNERTAKISTAALPAGYTTITATYNGDPDFTSSSASLIQTVN
jgi:hypothetical protein